MKVIESLKQHRRKFLNIALILIALGALFIYATSSHWWRELSNAKIIYNGQSVDSSSVYRSPNGELLVYLRGLSDERSLFVIYSTENKVGLPNENQFVILPKYAYSKEVSPPVVFMDSAKSETNPNLVIKDNVIEFTTSRGRRVQINLEGL
jgi:hypothetical protein